MMAISLLIMIYVLMAGLFDFDMGGQKKQVINIDLSGIQKEEIKYFSVLNKKILVLRRSQKMLEKLLGTDIGLYNIQSEMNARKWPEAAYRSTQAEYFVAYAYDPFYGCDIELRDEFLRPVCIDLRYDLAGRVYKSARAEDNLEIPDYEIKQQTLFIYE